jgi:hypothetical protein
LVHDQRSKRCEERSCSISHQPVPAFAFTKSRGNDHRGARAIKPQNNCRSGPGHGLE